MKEGKIIQLKTAKQFLSNLKLKFNLDTDTVPILNWFYFSKKVLTNQWMCSKWKLSTHFTVWIIHLNNRKTNRCNSAVLLQSFRGRRLLSLHLQDVRDEVLGVSQFILPLLRDAGSEVRPPRPKQRAQSRATVTVLTWTHRK